MMTENIFYYFFFQEPEIDQLRAQKDDDLERYRKDLDRRKRNFMDFEE